jgi:hypothetical protein
VIAKEKMLSLPEQLIKKMVTIEQAKDLAKREQALWRHL